MTAGVNPCALKLARPSRAPPGSPRRLRGRVLAHRGQWAHGRLRPLVDRAERVCVNGPASSSSRWPGVLCGCFWWACLPPARGAGCGRWTRV